MDKVQSAQVKVQDDKQDESSPGCGSEKTSEIILPKEKEGLNPGSSLEGSADGVTVTKVGISFVFRVKCTVDSRYYELTCYEVPVDTRPRACFNALKY